MFKKPKGPSINLGGRPSRRVLNIGAGLLPIVPSDIDADVVYNYDPLTKARKELASLPSFHAFLHAIHHHAHNVIYETEEDKIRAVVHDDSIDLLIAVSPYGFAAISDWVDDKLKFGAQVLVFGNRSNRFVTRNNKLFASEVDNVYREIPLPFGRWEQNVAAKIRTEYPSQTSALEKGTDLNLVRYFVKAYR